MDKACPVVIRAPRQVLAFQHPVAGLQLVKGGVDPDEQPSKAAERELLEEAGLSLRAVQDLGSSTQIMMGDTWHFWLMGTQPLPDQWSHDTEDDGGHRFDFFWFPLDQTPPAAFATPFQRALHHITRTLP